MRVMTDPVARAEIVVDLDAITHNAEVLRAVVAPAALMAVVKADGYGHGMCEVARAARRGGADWLGVATLDEAMTLRRDGDTGRLLCWLTIPGERYDDPVRAEVDLSAYSTRALDEIARAADRVDRIARVQLKIDTGLSRGGALRTDWAALTEHARRLEREGRIRVTGIWSHLVSSDDPDSPVNEVQEVAFLEAVAVAEAAGLAPEVRHLANSAAAVLRPSARFDLVRCGIALYGLDPAPGHLPELGLVPAMTVRGRVAMVKPVPAGAGVSYGHTWTAERDTTLALIPVGYGEGIPRAASPGAEVQVAGRRRPLRGRVCMDQVMVDLEGDLPEEGTEFVLLGPGTQGEPTAQEWAEACDTISYEIVTRVGGRLARRHVGGQPR
nr:alanine racemase [Nocardioides sp. 616]